MGRDLGPWFRWWYVSDLCLSLAQLASGPICFLKHVYLTKHLD